MSEYKNFNNYELTEIIPEKKEAPADTDYKADTYGAGAGSPGAGSNGQTGESVDTFGILSVILAPLSCCFIGLPAVVGLVLGILGLKKNKNSTLCIIGIVLCTLAILYMGYYIIIMIRNPEMYQQMIEEYMASIEEASQTAAWIFRR